MTDTNSESPHPSTCLCSAQELSTLMSSGAPVIILDVRYDLADPAAGKRAYAQGHIPGAFYLGLGTDLSGPPLTDAGRHPMPSVEAMTATFAGVGIGPDSVVVIYDQREGSTAARCWWMLSFLGLATVRVLDGGWAAWQAIGGAQSL